MIIMHSEIDKNKFKNGLYIVSTPIGNLGDITFRAIEVLKNSKHIFCEDTRVTKKLTSYFNIKSTLVSNHKFNESKNIKKIIELLNSGQIVSLVSDAGTPALSDPGRVIVEECVKKKINILKIEKNLKKLLPDIRSYKQYYILILSIGIPHCCWSVGRYIISNPLGFAFKNIIFYIFYV